MRRNGAKARCAHWELGLEGPPLALKTAVRRETGGRWSMLESFGRRGKRSRCRDRCPSLVVVFLLPLPFICGGAICVVALVSRFQSRLVPEPEGLKADIPSGNKTNRPVSLRLIDFLQPFGRLFTVGMAPVRGVIRKDGTLVPVSELWPAGIVYILRLLHPLRASTSFLRIR